MARAAIAEVGSAEKVAVPRVGYLVYRVERRLRARLDEEMRQCGVSTPEYVTLSVLRERDGCRARSWPAGRSSPRRG